MSRPKQVLACAALLPFVAGGGASGAYYLRMHRLCEGMDVAALPTAPPANASRRILVLAPHCDDETLGLGGMIADARRKGADVEVAFLTNGDGFRVAAGRALKDVNVGPADFVRFAELRQKESLRALAELGVAEESVKFLGYPDRGLQPMWEAHWDDSRPFRSFYTGHTHVPYARAVRPRAPYSAASLTRDLRGLMDTFRPTDVFVTHPDHSAAAAYAEAALFACRDAGADWAARARLRFYIVHRGDWPLPQGMHPDRPLSPPPGLVALDTRWSTFDLAPADEDAKRRALDQYTSQLNVSARFLRSFVRENELVGALPAPTVAPGAAVTAPDAAGDNIARYADRAADLTGISVARQGREIRVSVQVRGRPSPRVRYRIGLRAQSGHAPTGSRFVSRELPPGDGGSDGRTLETRIPLSELGIAPGDASGAALWACAETRWAAPPPSQPPVDRTGYRLFLFNKGSAAKP